MNLCFNTALAAGYKSKAQITRVLSESWATENVFCPCCGNSRLTKLDNNEPVADMHCDKCGEVFELKSAKGKLGKKIPDGAYETMIQRTLIPKFFFVPGIIEKRKPLPPTARRHGWVGCNILYGNIPKQGKIPIIKNKNVVDKKIVVEKYTTVKQIQTNNIETRGWLFDVLNCVNSVHRDIFTLKEMYGFVDVLQELHQDNHNIEAKIRQQLQLLRDKSFIEFLGNGVYRKMI